MKMGMRVTCDFGDLVKRVDASAVSRARRRDNRDNPEVASTAIIYYTLQRH